MVNVFDENELCKKYDFSDFISDEDDLKICKLCQDMVDEDNYVTDNIRSVPHKSMTKGNLFDLDDPAIMKHKKSFIKAARLYAEHDAKVTKINCWGLLLNSFDDDMRNQIGWHRHKFGSNSNIELTGIYYANIPTDVSNYDTFGTEFAPNGLENPERFFIRPVRKSWIIFPSSLYHCPGKIQTNQTRVTIVSDIELKK